MNTSPAKLNASERRAFRAALLRWFDAHRRQLPWRADRDPYRVWISEIMLQQTRVAAVLDHYRNFLSRFPDVATLARARQASVLAAWSGLGYYRRARMLHAAARQIVREFGGRFPRDAAGWRALPGIGRYTAAAIASICYREPCAVVDGNVRRVLHRLLGTKAREAWTSAGYLLSHARPGDFNQAMMELGATVCAPKAPQCGECPVSRWCRCTRTPSSATGHSRPRAARQQRELTYELILQHRRVWLVQRKKDESVMPGMWELPTIHPSKPKPGLPGTPQPPAVTRATGSGQRETVLTVRHAIMNTDFIVHVVRRTATPVAVDPRTSGVARWFPVARAMKLPLTGLARKILRRSGMI